MFNFLFMSSNTIISLLTSHLQLIVYTLYYTVLSAPIKILIHENDYVTSKFTKTENFLIHFQWRKMADKCLVNTAQWNSQYTQSGTGICCNSHLRYHFVAT